MARLARDKDCRELQKVVRLLGGSEVLPRRFRNALDAHDLLVDGLPVAAVDHLVCNLVSIGRNELLEKTIGISIRTRHPRKNASSQRLSPEQSGRAWRFAKILAGAIDVFGSLGEAERWLERSSTGLEQRCPIDLLGTPAGVKLVEEYLERLKIRRLCVMSWLSASQSSEPVSTTSRVDLIAFVTH